MAELNDRDEKLKIKIAQRIKQLREESGMTQSEFAREHMLDRQTLNRWENGRGVTIYTIEKFCRYIDMTLESFFKHDFFSSL